MSQMTERKTILKFVDYNADYDYDDEEKKDDEENETNHLIEKKDGKIFFDGKVVCIKKLEELKKEELETFNSAKKWTRR